MVLYIDVAIMLPHSWTAYMIITLLDFMSCKLKKTKKKKKRVKVQDTLQEVKLGIKEDKRPTFISVNFPKDVKEEFISLLKEYKDHFT